MGWNGKETTAEISTNVMTIFKYYFLAKMLTMSFLNRTSCGAMVEVHLSDPSLCRLQDSERRSEHFSDTMFHSGQILLGYKNSLENEIWLTPKPNFRSLEIIQVC